MRSFSPDAYPNKTGRVFNLINTKAPEKFDSLPKEYTKNYSPKKISSQEYIIDITAEKYRQMDRITVIVEDTDGKNAMVDLINNHPLLIIS
jgi:hypothetical protein